MLEVLDGRSVVQAAVRPFLIVFLPPGFDDGFGLPQRREPMLIQALIPSGDRTVSRKFIEAVWQVGVHKIVQIPKPELIENPD